MPKVSFIIICLQTMLLERGGRLGSRASVSQLQIGIFDAFSPMPSYEVFK